MIEKYVLAQNMDIAKKKKRIEFITHAVQSIKPVVMLVDSKVSLTWKLLVVNDPWCTFGLFTAIIPFLGTRL